VGTARRRPGEVLRGGNAIDAGRRSIALNVSSQSSGTAGRLHDVHLRRVRAALRREAGKGRRAADTAFTNPDGNQGSRRFHQRPGGVFPT